MGTSGVVEHIDVINDDIIPATEPRCDTDALALKKREIPRARWVESDRDYPGSLGKKLVVSDTHGSDAV